MLLRFEIDDIDVEEDEVGGNDEKEDSLKKKTTLVNIDFE